MKPMKTAISTMAIVALAFSATANLTTNNYGDFAAQSVDFLQVMEHTQTFGDTVPKYGEPIVNAGSDSMDFNPQGFSAEAGNGDIDLTDGNLIFQIQSRGDAVIEQVGFSEAGFYHFLGTGTDATRVSVTAALTLEVYEINGAPVAPFGQQFTLDFNPNDGNYNIVDNDTGGQYVAWEGSILVDINAMLAARGYDEELDRATKVSVDLNNLLTAISEQGTIASIAKKDFDVGVSIEVIPEPASALLLLGATGAIAFVRRRFIG